MDTVTIGAGLEELHADEVASTLGNHAGIPFVTPMAETIQSLCHAVFKGNTREVRQALLVLDHTTLIPTGTNSALCPWIKSGNIVVHCVRGAAAVMFGVFANESLSAADALVELHKTDATFSEVLRTILLAGDFDVDAKDHEGCTPLSIASMVGLEDVVSILIERGANPYIPSPNGEGILNKARVFRHWLAYLASSGQVLPSGSTTMLEKLCMKCKSNSAASASFYRIYRRITHMLMGGLLKHAPPNWSSCAACADPGEDLAHNGWCIRKDDGLATNGPVVAHAIALHKDSYEFLAVKEKFNSETTSLKLIAVWRVQNKASQDEYIRECMRVEADILDRFEHHGFNMDMYVCDVETTPLYHTTRGHLETLLRDGFDMRLGSTGLLGSGIYATTHPLKASSYWKLPFNRRTMLQCRMLTGRIYAFSPGDGCRARRKEPLSFDSVSGDFTGQTEHVVYRNERIKIDYVLDYEVTPEYAEEAASKLKIRKPREAVQPPTGSPAPVTTAFPLTPSQIVHTPLLPPTTQLPANIGGTWLSTTGVPSSSLLLTTLLQQQADAKKLTETLSHIHKRMKSSDKL
jgi:hypothetical protein